MPGLLRTRRSGTTQTFKGQHRLNELETRAVLGIHEEMVQAHGSEKTRNNIKVIRPIVLL
jgi:hypothetical protein